MRISDWSSDVCSSDLIIGLCRENRSTKLLFENDSVRECSEISPYLVPGQRVIVKPRERTISPIAVMAMGSNPVDGKRLILEKSEADVIVKQHPESQHFFRPYGGTTELLTNALRTCLWVDDGEVDQARIGRATV